ncbi:phenylalanine ammonia-lyase [Lojkania enalia]|uniref:Phenylalanine ammonia-lyase n=1 Tax=Lojkania enalia TaxID=147567 RepID=A0A9P4N3L0_9PLEO|nr:phenylalanine ammonia-lyase [Didymosphaeria enalia]
MPNYPHPQLVKSLWINGKSDKPIVIDGNSLNIANVVSISKQGATSILSTEKQVSERINKSVQILNENLAKGWTVYGVNTGFGGSADVRCGPNGTHTLQRAFLQHLHCGILHNTNTASSMKEEWVRAAMVIRANSVARGHSAVRLSTIQALLSLVNNNIIPLIPLRGSISASGDLSPLSYIAGVLEGNPHLSCWIGPTSSRRLVSAPEALDSVSLSPVVFEPKEALGLVNGTAISCAVASLTLSSMHKLLFLSQLITAMNVEAMLGTSESFEPFLSKARPHRGQEQVSSTLFAVLQGSKLADTNHGHALFQDRYSLRTVPQWLGPFVEDLLLSQVQVTIELNSTTDNPLIEPETGEVHHGGNFQAVSVTSAMEKCKLAAQAIGRMLFSQFTELVNPATNRGLPPNLCADEPSTSFTLKGVDIGMAAYISELSFLANPLHNHVVSAEMGNQSLNSLALVSARYADEAVDILRMMCASALYGACQALDLRAIMRIFKDKVEKAVGRSIKSQLSNMFVADARTIQAIKMVVAHIHAELDKTTTQDTEERFRNIMAGAKGIIFPLSPNLNAATLDKIRYWVNDLELALIKLWNETRNQYFVSGDASELLGVSSRRLYHFIRKELKVPMHRGVADHPTVSSDSTTKNDQIHKNPSKEKTIGQWISIIYEAIKEDSIMDTVVFCIEQCEVIYRTNESLTKPHLRIREPKINTSRKTQPRATFQIATLCGISRFICVYKAIWPQEIAADGMVS